MRVSKGRPIGASAADKVLDKGRNYSDSNWYVRTTNESNGGVALGSLAFLMCRTSILGRWRLVSDFLNGGLFPRPSTSFAPPRACSRFADLSYYFMVQLSATSWSDLPTQPNVATSHPAPISVLS